MVIENFQTPESVRGSGNMRYMAIFDTVNCSVSVRLHMPAHSSGASHAVTRNVQNLRRTLLRCNDDDALQAGATPSDMRNDFEKGLIVIEKFQTPEPARGSVNMRHMASVQFTFHTVNCRFRDCACSYARTFVRGLPCGHKDRAKVAAYPTPTQRRSKTHYKRVALRAT